MNYWLCLVCNELNDKKSKECKLCSNTEDERFFNEYLRLNHYIDQYIYNTITKTDMEICDYETQGKLGLYLIDRHIKSRVYWRSYLSWKR